MGPDDLETAKNGLGVAIGLLLVGYAAQSTLWYGYMRANPAVGTVSTSPGFAVINALLFVVGVVIAYTFFVRGLPVTRPTARE